MSRRILGPFPADSIIVLLTSTTLLAQVDEHAPLAAAGMSSSGAQVLASALGVVLGAKLPSTLAYNYPTVARIAAYLQDLISPVAGRASAGPGQVSSLEGGALGTVVTPAYEGNGWVGSRRVFITRIATRLPAMPAATRMTCSSMGPAGEDAVRVLPASRTGARDAQALALADTDCAVQFLAAVRAVHLYDNTLFGTPHSEACAMDPQQRLLLEGAFQVLQGRLKSTTGANWGGEAFVSAY